MTSTVRPSVEKKYVAPQNMYSYLIDPPNPSPIKNELKSKPDRYPKRSDLSWEGVVALPRKKNSWPL